MSIDAGVIASLWRSTPPSSHGGELQANKIPGATGMWVARGSDGHRHLLVTVPTGYTHAPTELRGLALEVGQFRVNGVVNRFIDLECLDPALDGMFTHVATDVVNAGLAASGSNLADAVLAAIRRWQWFWSGSRTGLSHETALGLLGELWFLKRWLGATSATITSWAGPDRSRHDFQTADVSVEVKTTASSGLVSHEIQSLEQLDDPSVGDLYLFSLKVSADRVGVTSIASLVSEIESALSGDPVARGEFLRLLTNYGYSPVGDDRVVKTYRVVEQALFRVDASFPRLTRSKFPGGLPAAIPNVSYTLDLNACSQWQVATRPTAWPPP